jgi:hypothetical protein
MAMTIRHLNDEFRRTLHGGRVVMTRAISLLGQEAVNKITTAVRLDTNFTDDNDPHREHDFGKVEVDGVVAWWKIDYYDERCAYGSEDPADPAQTTRVLTIMLPEDY